MLAATVAIGRMLYALVGCQLPQSPLVGCCMQGWYAGLASHLLFMLSNAGHVSLKFVFDFEKPRNNGTLPLFKLVHGVTLMF